MNQALPITVGGLALSSEGCQSLPLEKGGLLMITYGELFQFCLVIIGIVGLFIQANKKK